MLFYKVSIKNSKKNRHLVYLLLLISFISFLGCTRKKFRSEEKLWKYLNDSENGYRQEKIVNGVNYSLLYKPIDLIVKQESGDDKSKIGELRKKYNDYMYFTLSMSRNGQELLNSATGSREEFGNMVNQLAFDMDKKVHLYTPQKDTLEILDYIYPRMFGMSSNTNMIFVFPRDEKYLKEDYLNFSIEDIGFYTGEVRFKVPVKNIKNEPKLNF